MGIRMGSINSSSLIKSVGFAGGPGEVGTLRIRFKDAVIDFYRVPYKIYRALVLARDHSANYLKNVHGRFDYNKVS